MSLAEKLIRPHLKGIVPYSSARDEYTGKVGVFLDANENPYGSVAGGEWNRYPDPYQQDLKKAISTIKGVDQGMLFLGNGSDEPIDLLIRAFCEPGIDKILTFPPTYGMYGVSASIHNVDNVKVSLTPDFQLDMDGFYKTDLSGIKLAFICSPNNPSGNALNQKDMLDVVRNFDGLVVVDEAYIDFAPDQTLVNYLENFPNLIVLQTFSKAWGLASFRLGIAFAQPEIIQILNHIKPPYNLSGPIQKQALSALMGFTQKNKWVGQIVQNRKHLIEELENLDVVEKVFPSDANFLLVKFKEAKQVFDYLIGEKVIVRDRSKMPLCDNCLRITVGTEKENERLITCLSAYN